jgi:phosphoribulokinase
MVDTAKPLEAIPRADKHIFVLIFRNYIFILSPYLRMFLSIIAFLSDFFTKTAIRIDGLLTTRACYVYPLLRP